MTELIFVYDRSSLPIPPACPFPSLEHLELRLGYSSFLELLSSLEDPATLPALKRVELSIIECEVSTLHVRLASRSRMTLQLINHLGLECVQWINSVSNDASTADALAGSFRRGGGGDGGPSDRGGVPPATMLRDQDRDTPLLSFMSGGADQKRLRMCHVCNGDPSVMAYSEHVSVTHDVSMCMHRGPTTGAMVLLWPTDRCELCLNALTR